jgi:hypothetical protein
MKTGFETDEQTVARTSKLVIENERNRNDMLRQVRSRLKKGTRSHKKWE